MNTTKKINILLVDDKPKNLFALKTILEKPEYDILTATSGNDALSMLLEHDILLAILDVQMPGIDGFEIAKMMKNNKKTKYIPIIFVTGINKEKKYKFKGYEVGAVDYLVKPIDPDILSRKVDVFVTLKLAQNDLKKTVTDLETEIKRRKLIEEELLLKERLEGVIEMAGTVCHEFTQPLQIISGYSDLILMDIEEQNDLHQKVYKIKEQVKRITKLIQKLVGITRYETKSYLGKTKIIDLDNVKERRKHKRFMPKNKTIVIPRYGSFGQGQIIDISRGGLAFWHNETLDIPDKFTEVTISVSDKSITLEKLSCKFLTNNTAPNAIFANHKKMKRHSLQFEKLSKHQESQLEHFILHYTSAKTDEAWLS